MRSNQFDGETLIFAVSNNFHKAGSYSRVVAGATIAHVLPEKVRHLQYCFSTCFSVIPNIGFTICTIEVGAPIPCCCPVKQNIYGRAFRVCEFDLPVRPARREAATLIDSRACCAV